MNLKSISIYPVKSMRSIDLESSAVTSRGLEFDRRYMVVDHDSSQVTQREASKLARLETVVKHGKLILKLDGLQVCEWNHNIDKENASETGQVTVWDSNVEAVFAPRTINDWLSNFLSMPVRLTFMPDSSRRAVNSAFNHGEEIVSFADGYPLLLTNTASLLDLNSRSGSEITMERFRPNVVVEGDIGFSEDSWQRIRIGSQVFRITKACARCVVTTLDQSQGVSLGKEPLQMMSGFRKAKDIYRKDFEKYGFNPNDLLFGMNMVPEVPLGRISIGDEVTVLA